MNQDESAAGPPSAPAGPPQGRGPSSGARPPQGGGREATSGGDLTAPDHIRAISRYIAGKPTDELARELGLDATTIVKLASNENPRGPGPGVRAAIADAVAELPRYPDSNAFTLKAALSKRLNVAPEQLVLGNGSNDVLELVTLAFLQPDDEAVFAEHAFIVYPLATQARGARGIVVPAKQHGHDLAAMRAAITRKTRIVFVANPNNPTGTWLAPAHLEAFIASVPRDVVVVLDEAYNEYLPAVDRAPSVEWIARYPNLVVTRTFSKAYGLAALRVGYGVMSEGVAELLNRVRQPFNVNALAQAAAVAALADADYVEESRLLNEAGLAQLYAGLQVLGVRYVESRANFVLANVGSAAEVNDSLLRQGVIVRPVANYGLPAWLRITVGLPEENTRFLTALAKALKG